MNFFFAADRYLNEVKQKIFTCLFEHKININQSHGILSETKTMAMTMSVCSLLYRDLGIHSVSVAHFFHLTKKLFTVGLCSFYNREIDNNLYKYK